MINIFDYYSLKLNIIEFNQNKITQDELRGLLNNIKNIPTSINKWDILFYIQQILLPNLQNAPDSEQKKTFIAFFLNSLFSITEFDYESNEKDLLFQYCLIESINKTSIETDIIEEKIKNIQNILYNSNYSNYDEKYIYFFLKEKLRQTLIKEYNKLPAKEFYKNKDEISKQLIIVKQHLDKITQIEQELNKIDFITE